MRNAHTSWTRDPAITRKMALRCGKSLKVEELLESFLGGLFQSRIAYISTAVEDDGMRRHDDT
jgi:hypothetical protein